MINYTPFLKAKSGEFSAFQTLEPSIKRQIVPFFDLPKKNVPYTENSFVSLVERVKKKIERIEDLSAFYMDDYDIPNSLLVNNKQAYYEVIKSFEELNFIPIIGINRSDVRNNVVFTNSTSIKTQLIAIRLELNDLQTGLLDIKNLIADIPTNFQKIDLIIDLRVIDDKFDIIKATESINSFLAKNLYNFRRIIISGSSIPQSIGLLVETNKIAEIKRKELDIFRLIKIEEQDSLFFGDYTIISPNYSDFVGDVKFLNNVMTAKMLYSYGNNIHIIRGSSIKQNGYEQYKNFCKQLSLQPFFRGADYSIGDSFIAQALETKKNITPSSIIKPLVNAHITYMWKDFQL